MKKAPAWKARLAKALGRPERLAVLGVGNLDKGDDGAGVRAARILEERLGEKSSARVRVFVGHDVPENLTGPIRRFEPSHVLIVDAASGGYAPGSVFLVDADSVAHEEISAHRTPLSALAGYLKETCGCPVTIVGIEPARFVPRARLTPAVAKSAAAVATAVGRLASRRVRSSSASRRRYS